LEEPWLKIVDAAENHRDIGKECFAVFAQKSERIVVGENQQVGGDGGVFPDEVGDGGRADGFQRLTFAAQVLGKNLDPLLVWNTS